LFWSSTKTPESEFSKGMTCYRKGRFSPCRRRWQKLAERGEARAQSGLAHLYANGLGVDKDLGLAFEWTLKAAEQGLMQAQNNLGWYYEHGIGVACDFSQALTWYEQAAEQGDGVAQTNLAYIHARGRGVDADAESAIFWYQRAAEHGNRQACEALADAYENGTLGLQRDPVKAGYWHNKAYR